MNESTGWVVFLCAITFLILQIVIGITVYNVSHDSIQAIQAVCHHDA